VRLGDTALRFTGFPETLDAPVGRSFDYQYYNNLATPRPGWQTSTGQLRVNRVVGGNAASRTYSKQTNEGAGASLQSFFWKDRIVTLLGWRKDTVKSFLPALLPDATYPFPNLPGGTRNDFLATGSNYRFSQASATQSIVFKLTDEVRLLANRSENFAATIPRQDNLFRPIPPQSGKTNEAGIGVNLFRNKLDVKLTYFKSSQLLTSSSSGVAGLRIKPMEDTIYNALLNAGRISEWSTVGVNGSRSTAQYDTPNNANATEDNVSKGYGLEVYFQPSRSWDFVFSADKIENVATNINKELFEFFAIRAPFYKKFFDEGLRNDGSNSRAPNPGSPLVQAQMVTLAGQFANEILREGTSNRGLSPLKASFVGRYKFTQGRLNGLSLGTNLRWEDKKLTGYGQKNIVYNFGGLENYAAPGPDTKAEYYTGQVLAGGMTINYSQRLYRDRVRWKIQLNADNIFSETGLRKIANNADGSAIWGVAPPRSYSLTNTFEF
jgi:hypothetical protein